MENSTAEQEALQPERITWSLEQIRASDLKPNPKNPKTKNKQGADWLKQSLDKFGAVYDGIANADLSLIDGHSRLEQYKPGDMLRIFIPSRQLDEKEYTEMNAMFDLAQAGDTNMQLIEEIFTEEQMEEWDIDKKTKKAQQKAKGAVYPLVPRFDEKYQAIVIVCSSEINATFIKNALGIGTMQSYKNSMVKETSVITEDQFIEQWNKEHGNNSQSSTADNGQSE